MPASSPSAIACATRLAFDSIALLFSSTTATRHRSSERRSIFCGPEAVRRGQQALLLVPEISLTPVFAARLKERFGERIAILHSSLSASERYDQWWRARRGEVDVAIGPRSALFTPFHELGMIVVDEEGDGAYKQDENPRYNARDLAVVRAQLRGIPVVLGSATPSLESRDNAP